MFAWATLLTDPGYLLGVRVLNASLRRTGTAHPLVVMVTPAIDAGDRAALVGEGCLVREVAPVLPASGGTARYANARFAQVWTKLAAWSLVEFERLVVLDADMLVVAAMEELFDVELPAGGIAACHACRCNPNRIATYPASWTPANCFYTHCRGLDHVQEPELVDDYLNGGFLVIEPSAVVFADMVAWLSSLEDLAGYAFAEQDFLNEYYHGRWRPLPYVYNALKTLTHQHPSLWDDAAVKNIHYILDKPWERRPAPEDRYVALDQLWWDAADQL